MSEARRKQRAEARELLRKLKKTRRAELAAMTPEQKRAMFHRELLAEAMAGFMGHRA